MRKDEIFRDGSVIKHTKKSQLLSDRDVKRWYNNLSRGSILTAESQMRKLGRFCELQKLTPRCLIDIARKDLIIVTNMLEDHVTMMESQGYCPGYIENQIKTIKSWLKYFDIDIRRNIRVRFANSTPTIQNEKIPETYELDEVYERAELRESAIISLMAKSGLRPEVIGNYNGTDGLQMRDMPDISIYQGFVRCTRMPNKIIVRPELSKAGHQYFTFSTQSATRHIVAYLNARLRHGELLHARSPIIASNSVQKTGKGKRSTKIFLPTPQISEKIRRTFRPQFTWRPYVLRAYFDTQLLIAESKGKMIHDFRVFFMGHKGTMESRYTTNKGILPEILIREMSEAFIRSEKYLDQVNTDPVLDQRREMMNMIERATPTQLNKISKIFREKS